MKGLNEAGGREGRRGEHGPVRLGFGIKPEPQPYIFGF